MRIERNHHPIRHVSPRLNQRDGHEVHRARHSIHLQPEPHAAKSKQTLATLGSGVGSQHHDSLAKDLKSMLPAHGKNENLVEGQFFAGTLLHTLKMTLGKKVGKSFRNMFKAAMTQIPAAFKAKANARASAAKHAFDNLAKKFNPKKIGLELKEFWAKMSHSLKAAIAGVQLDNNPSVDTIDSHANVSGKTVKKALTRIGKNLDEFNANGKGI